MKKIGDPAILQTSLSNGDTGTFLSQACCQINQTFTMQESLLHLMGSWKSEVINDNESKTDLVEVGGLTKKMSPNTLRLLQMLKFMTVSSNFTECSEKLWQYLC